MSDAIGYYGEGGQAASQSAYFQNLYDRKSEWGRPTSTQEQPELRIQLRVPLGKNKMWGANWSPVVNGILGGWQMGGSSIYAAVSRSPSRRPTGPAPSQGPESRSLG